MKTEKLIKKYPGKELAEAFVFRSSLTPKQKKEADTQLRELRKKSQKDIDPETRLLSGLFQLKFRIEEYLKGAAYDPQRSFASYLKEYLQLLGVKNKTFAKAIGIKETELSQLLNAHRKPSEKIIVRLEIHSDQLIPAITWFRLLEREKEHELLTNTALRRSERKFVKSKLKLSA